MKLKFDSKLEESFSKMLDDEKISWINQYRIGEKKYDFYLPKYNILIEIDGDYWHSNSNTGFIVDKKFKKKIFRNDILKNLLAEQNGFKLIRIWEADLKKMNSRDIHKYINE